ncbi:MAG: hypothetical protein FWF71_02700 [Actinomycetia bacterium]|nr:hypothetical protein [Actinomycetes bacterium]
MAEVGQAQAISKGNSLSSSGKTAGTDKSIYISEGPGRKTRLILRFLVWLAVIVVVVLLALLVSAWLAGFRFENGLPDLGKMFHFIFYESNYHT